MQRPFLGGQRLSLRLLLLPSGLASLIRVWPAYLEARQAYGVRSHSATAILISAAKVLHRATSHSSSKDPQRSAVIPLANHPGYGAQLMKNSEEMATCDLRPASALVGYEQCLRLLLLESFAQPRFCSMSVEGGASWFPMVAA